MTALHHSQSQRKAVWLVVLTLAGATLVNVSQAEWSVTLTGTTDYLFNGVSQTGRQPAIQGSLDWAGANGFYAGTWASNVDFGDDTEAEVDLYTGYVHTFSDSIALDTGLAVYTYHGGSNSSDANYPELYTKLGVGPFSAKLWYTHDYAGLDVPHITAMLGAEWAPMDQVLLNATVDRSTSLDGDRFSWDEDRDHYYHWQLTADTSQFGVDFSLGFSGTDLQYDAGATTVFFTLSRTFAF
jgi:uncharacterized protein (TIGR02001 family)